MSKRKMYYWLKLENDFFEKIEIKRLRRMAGGDTFTIIYLKMLLLSLKEEGNLFYDGIGDDFIDELSLDIDEEVDDVKMVVMYLQDKKLIELLSKDEYHLRELPEMIGKETDSAVRMRRKRLNDNKANKITSQCDSDVQESYTEIEKEIELDIDKTISQKPKHVFNERHYNLANLLYEEILKNYPTHKKPNLEKWAVDVRRMMDIDGRTEEQISYLIKWSQQNTFWSSNILSTSKLRKQYDVLVAKVISERKGNVASNDGNEDIEELEREFGDEEKRSIGDVQGN